MKKCKYCGSIVEADAPVCNSCGANEFKYICDNCGNEFDNGLHCPKCGIKVGQKEKICPKCGNHYFTNACSNCGYSELNSSAPQPVYNPVEQSFFANGNTTSKNDRDRIEFFLCLFLGFYGVHKFYRGKFGMGLLYLFTGGLFLFGWLYDLITLGIKVYKE